MQDANERLIRNLREKVDELTEENRQLKAQLKEQAIKEAWDVPFCFKLSAAETRVFQLLVMRQMTPKDMIWRAIDPYGHKEFHANHLSVVITHIRRKLRPFGCTVECVWGMGYKLPDETRMEIERLIQEQKDVFLLGRHEAELQRAIRYRHGRARIDLRALGLGVAGDAPAM